MTLPIVQTGNPILRQKARLLTKDEILSSPIQHLIEEMKATMDEAPGVGLAAPQIGESIQLIVIEDKKEYIENLAKEALKERERSPVPFHIIINPVLTIVTETYRQFYEGCLSIAGFVGKVERARTVKVTCLNEKAEPITINAQGWYARILQHEIDHLNGFLCIDRMDMKSFTTIDNYQHFILNQE